MSLRSTIQTHFTVPTRHHSTRQRSFSGMFSAPASTTAGAPTPIRRFPLNNTQAEPSLGSPCELDFQKGALTGDCVCADRQLEWLRRNLVKSEKRDFHGMSKVKMPEGNPSWPRYHFPLRSCSYIYDPPNESKLAFITPENYCKLCCEPVELPIRHCAWWDHVTRMAGLRLTAIYPRRWDPSALMQELWAGKFPVRFMNTERPHPYLRPSHDGPSWSDLRQCYVFEREAVVRRGELRAILHILSTDVSGGRRVLRESLVLSPDGSYAANVGERTFRAFISRHITPLLPPMGPEPTTRLQQRCWGRKNLEAMFDLLGVEALQRLSGVEEVAVTKNEKATVMRQIVYELTTVLSECDARELSASNEHANEGAHSVKIAKDETHMQVRLLVELALQRLSHELIHLHMMLLIERVWNAYANLGYPGEEAFEESTFC
ncbi:hypothetical protein, conserved [Trypanosoma brucei brucei TREU927]|uniref:Uncharacterized protein n=1 Tax=Trypanosoma brucei brucei (strain 927/4 GUTat10.1) TaxID=185431 RepID=Q38F97_TRYB2|nr:hypothetical protein, conserved [Trypanosoma brucei brucei TREU927]EAN76523.1 hypothetical protein, conserved [Trypanosoma brucei brucei TREU927]